MSGGGDGGAGHEVGHGFSDHLDVCGGSFLALAWGKDTSFPVGALVLGDRGGRQLPEPGEDRTGASRLPPSRAQVAALLTSARPSLLIQIKHPLGQPPIFRVCTSSPHRPHPQQPSGHSGGVGLGLAGATGGRKRGLGCLLAPDRMPPGSHFFPSSFWARGREEETAHPLPVSGHCHKFLESTPGYSVPDATP